MKQIQNQLSLWFSILLNSRIKGITWLEEITHPTYQLANTFLNRIR